MSNDTQIRLLEENKTYMYIDISVIIPVYNPPHDKFERCIESLVSQTGDLCYEFIFVNDGSTDCWIAERLERLEKEDNRVVVINQENKGVSVARNTGMDKARGEYVAFVMLMIFMKSTHLNNCS